MAACAARKAAFLAQHGSGYGYNGQIDTLVRKQFSRLAGKVYVDHAGATLYSEAQMQAVMQDLTANMYSNPHSQHAGFGERGSADAEVDARALTLAMCHASSSDYECIFTSGATAALKLVAECFPWSPGSTFAYTLDNHNSVLGMRGVAMQAGAAAIAVTACRSASGDWQLERASDIMTRSTPHHQTDSAATTEDPPECLFAFPAESNFDGTRLDLSLVQHLQTNGLQLRKGRWRLLLDAAKACATAPPDLSRFPADFTVLSFYKIFGYPTGLGALIVRKDALALLRPTYFGGGTVEVSVADADFHRKRSGVAGFEDGTTSYLAYVALQHGFEQLQLLGGFPSIQAHTAALTSYTVQQLTALRHANGRRVCTLYRDSQSTTPNQGQCDSGGAGQGPIVTFNLLRGDGSYVGYREVEKLAGLCGIYLRSGAFCNPGACAQRLGLTGDQLRRNYEAGHVCWDDNDLVDGQPIGAVRVSYGYMSTFEDAGAVLQFIREYFVEANPAPDTATAASQQPQSDIDMSAEASTCAAVAARCTTESLALASAVASEPIQGLMTANCNLSSSKADVSGISTPDGLERPRSPATLSDEGPDAHASATGHHSRLLHAAVVDTAEQLRQRQLSSRPCQVSTSAPSPAGPACAPSAAPFTLTTAGQAAASPQHPLRFGPLSSSSSAAGQQPPKDEPRGPSAGLSPQLQQPPSSTAIPDSEPQSLGAQSSDPDSQPYLQAIWVYPIKSCAGYSVQVWPLGPNGLLFDREWALVDESGEALRQRKVPKMTSIQPSINLEAGVMTVAAPHMATTLQVPLPPLHTHTAADGRPDPGDAVKPDAHGLERVRICGASVCSTQAATVAGDASLVSAWFSEALGVPCCLVQQLPGSRNAVARELLQKGRVKSPHTASTEETIHTIGFANEGQFLLANAASIADLNARLAAKGISPAIPASRFRPNMLVAGGQGLKPYAEDSWRALVIGEQRFEVAGPCARCDMICMGQEGDQSATSMRGEQGGQARQSAPLGRPGPEPLLTLAGYRRTRGRIHFGLLLSHAEAAPKAASAQAAASRQSDPDGRTMHPRTGVHPCVAVGMPILPMVAQDRDVI